MRLVIELWNERGAGCRQIASQFNVPWSTLRDRIKNKDRTVTGSKRGLVGGFTTVFSEDDKNELCAYILRMEEVLLGLSRDDVRHIAYQMADRNNLKHNFNNETEMAGTDWLMYFGHAMHTKNIELIDLARENNVHIICLPPHCTHRLQPLDVAFMKPLSSYYDEAVRNWLRCYPGRVVTIHQIESCLAMPI